LKKKSIKKWYFQRLIKDKNYKWNKNKIREHILIFVWPMHIPGPYKRKKKKKKNLVATKPPRITIHALLYWKHHHVMVLVTRRSSVFGRAGESTLCWNTTDFSMCWRVFFKRLQYIYVSFIHIVDSEKKYKKSRKPLFTRRLYSYFLLEVL